MKSQRATATRYARALFESARATGEVEAVGRDLEEFHTVFAAQPELRQVLGRPWIKPEERQELARGVAERVGASPLVRDFVALVAARRRIDLLAEIADVYRGLVDESLGRVRAQVQSAVPLTPDEQAQLGARLERLMARQVVLEPTVAPDLLGGFVARVGSVVVDGSLDGQLARMRQRLARGQA
jgi:F-type H+-transporting ATPase subunit delta